MARPAMRTFLFSDLRDYTMFIETRGDEAATKMLRAVRRIVREAVGKHRGAEVKTEGDSFYVVFRAPSSAVRCAIDVQRRIADHNGRHPDLPIHMGIGINTGEAVPHEKGYVGAAVVLAQRMTANAKTGQILVTDTVRALVRTGAHAPMRDLGTWTFKGIAQGVRVYEVEPGVSTAARALGPALAIPPILAEAPAAGPGIVVCSELVQRDEQLAVLVEQLTAAATGEAPIVALAGEGGIGKSRLCRELAQIADRDGFYVLAGRPEHTGAGAYEPFIAALRPYAHARGIEVLRRLVGRLVSELRRLLPELEVGATADIAPLPEEERRERFFRTIQLLLEDAASLRPVLLVLEDMHDADPATYDLLRYLAVSLRAGLCMVVTYREEDLRTGHPLTAVLTQLDRDHRLSRLTLTPLDEEGVRRMTAAMLPDRSGDGLVHTVFDRSQGVPYYVEELLKTALDDPSARPDHFPVPRTVRDSVLLRVSRLVERRGEAVADLLEAVAVAATPLEHDLVIQLSQRRDHREASVDLEACVESQLLERRPGAAELYQFRHSLTGEAIASAIPPSRARRLHLRVAEAISATFPGSGRAAMLARHFALAGDRARAIRYAREGAAAATRIGAYATTIEILREAAEHAGGTPEELGVLEELAVALRAAGRAAEAGTIVDRARAIARERDDVRSLARLDVLLASVLRIEGRRPEAATAARRAVAALEGGQDEDLAHALVTLAELHWAENDAVRAAAVAQQALPIARQRKATPIVIAALALFGAALLRQGIEEGRVHLEEAIALGSDADLPSETVEAYFELARAQLLRGQPLEASRNADAALTLARDRGLEFQQARLLSFLTTLRVNEGRYREARNVAEQALALAKPGTIAEGAAKIGLANLLITVGDPAGALALLDQVEEQIERLDPDRRELWSAYRALALLGTGRLHEAKASADEAMRSTRALQRLGMTTFLSATEVAEARRDGEWIREIEGAFESYFAGRDTGPIRAVRAEIAAVRALCESRDAAPDFERAAAEWEALGGKGRATYRRASSLISQLADPTRAEQAAGELEMLRALLEEWGALRYVGVIDGALARPEPEPVGIGGVLDQEELRIAMLVSRGMTDTRIAAELGVSSAEASRQVRRVLEKLGVKSRSQLASWAVTQSAIAEGSLAR